MLRDPKGENLPEHLPQRHDLPEQDDLARLRPEHAGFSQPAASGFRGTPPVHIPELKRETFAKAHEQWYNAANALIVPDGTLYLDAALVLLDEALPAGQRQPTPPPPL